MEQMVRDILQLDESIKCAQGLIMTITELECSRAEGIRLMSEVAYLRGLVNKLTDKRD